MGFSVQGMFSVVMLLALSGCVTSHYENDKGCDCTRRYFTPFGISIKECSATACGEALRSDKAVGVEVKVAQPPTANLRQTAPAKAIEQNIKSTTRF